MSTISSNLFHAVDAKSVLRMPLKVLFPWRRMWR